MRVLSSRSKNLLFVIKLIVYALKIIGLAPFAVVYKASINPRDSSVQIFKYSKIGLAYNILVLIPVLVIVAIMFYMPHWFSASSSHESHTFDAEAVVFMAESVLFILAACVVVISWGCKQKDAATIMNRVLEINVKLSIFKQQPFTKRSLTFVVVHAIINASLWVTFWARRMVYFHMDVLLPTFFTKIPDYIIYWFIIEYFMVASLLAQYLRTVNECLLNFNEFGNYLSRPRVRDSPGDINGVANLPTDRSGQLSSLKLLHSIRTKLSELCGEVSDFFSLPILFCITCCFIPLVREVYVVSTFSSNTDATVAATASYTFLIIFLYVYPVLSLALNITRTVKESKQTGSIIHKLLVSPIGREVKAELTQFSIQLLHEEVKFTAFGFFTLESTLLLSMLGGAASYFVALMQFKTTCTCKALNITRH